MAAACARCGGCASTGACVSPRLVPQRTLKLGLSSGELLLELELFELCAGFRGGCGAEAHGGLLEATQRLQRRLGPQRTKDATDSIRSGDLSSACAVILDYYDRCYSYELNRRSTPITRLPVKGLSASAVAHQLLQLKSA